MYMIHTCPQRKWYVNRYLIPSMLEQGIDNSDIIVYSDEAGDGHLMAFLNSWKLLKGDDTWHLQDDVIIASNFKYLTEMYNEGIVCGFCNKYSKTWNDTGLVPVDKMWYSMPCIHIPNEIMKEFVGWFVVNETQAKYKAHIMAKKHSDVLFWDFLKERHPDMKVTNLIPNIVNHIDYLIGGSLINNGRKERPQEIMALYWKEPALIIQLERELERRHDGRAAD